MEFHMVFLQLACLLMFITVSCALVRDNNLELNRSSFPEGFTFGTASSAYQYEGAASEAGRGPCIWDAYTHEHPERIADGSNGDVAVDSYHRYKDDVNIMKDMGLDAYRFSISWSRILPNGRLSGGINREGINHYNKFINELISNGLQPFVTLFHFDSPQGLEDKYGGFLSSNIAEDFSDYAGICFSEFGDRVKHWITFNEPWSFSVGGYAGGFLAPVRCSPWASMKCEAGDSGREPYIVGHNQLLAHAAAVKLYRDRFKPRQNGNIGISLVSNWMVPYSNTKSNSDAVERALDFMYGWFMDPLTRGDYPLNMRRLVGSRLPKFTKDQSRMLKGSFDFIGLNYYTANYIYSLPAYKRMNKSYFTDSCINQTALRDGIPIGPRAGSSWLYIYPKGIRDLLLYTKAKYNNPVIYITENGVDEVNNGTLSLEESLEDDTRIDYHSQHLYYVQSAIRCLENLEKEFLVDFSDCLADIPRTPLVRLMKILMLQVHLRRWIPTLLRKGVDVRGYFAWSMLDNFEWMAGYTVRFGMNYVAYDDGLKRYPKKSALWFTKFLRK